MITEIWLLITAIVFTRAGIAMERRRISNSISLIVEQTIDSLIKDDYIKSKLDKNGEVELLKHYED